MKVSSAAYLYTVILLGLCGCQKSDKGVDVIIDGGGRFPEHLAGTWKADKHGWEFVFESDGNISSAVIGDGMLRVKPSEKSGAIKEESGRETLYTLGEWTVQCSPGNRELNVGVVVKDFQIYVGQEGFGGSSTDWFVGHFSEDGQLWTAEWFTFQKNIVYTTGQAEPTVLGMDPNDNPIDVLVFRKQ